METDVGFVGINYAEGGKYIAMNSTAHECRISPLRRILPVRSSNMGVRPGVSKTWGLRWVTSNNGSSHPR